MNVFESTESNVRSYCRSFPVVFDKAKGAYLYTESGKVYIDFLSGAGALNYGHNNEYIKGKVLSYISSDGITHGLDMYTRAKKEFLFEFDERILNPKKLDYKVQFCGPTGTNAVEASLKLARKIKKRTGVFSFMGGFHGMSLGSLSVTSNKWRRKSAGTDLNNVTFLPYPNGTFGDLDTINFIERILDDTHSGIDKPAAIIFETVQAEGGINIADVEWIRRLRELCTRNDILMICDDIQVGCGRTGSFFSFERAGIVPDMVTLAKSISGYGLPMSLLLIRSELDIWEPGEHNGTFRGNQIAFVAAKAALEYRDNEKLEEQVRIKAAFIKTFLETDIKPIHPLIKTRGIGMIWGVDLSGIDEKKISHIVTAKCFEKGVIIEKAGSNDTVVKIMPPLMIDMDILSKGCEILKQSLVETLQEL